MRKRRDPGRPWPKEFKITLNQPESQETWLIPWWAVYVAIQFAARYYKDRKMYQEWREITKRLGLRKKVIRLGPGEFDYSMVHEYNRMERVHWTYWPAFHASDEELLAPEPVETIYYENFLYVHEAKNSYPRRVSSSGDTWKDEFIGFFGYCRSKEDHSE